MLNTTRVEGCAHVSPTFDFLEYRQRKNCERNVNSIFQKWEKREQTEWQTWFYVIMTVYETEQQQYTCIYRVHLYYYIREQTEWKTWLYVIMPLYEAVLPQCPCIEYYYMCRSTTQCDPVCTNNTHQCYSDSKQDEFKGH